MSMTLAQMRQELKARNPDYFSDLRANTLLNEAYHEVCESYDWPFLETTTTGTAPLTIADLRLVVDVTDTTSDTHLTVLSHPTLATSYPDLPDTGTPSYYYLDSPTVLKVYPASTSASLSVRYLKVPADLAADGDTPILPSRYQLVIVDCAQARELAQGPNPNASNLNRMQAVQSYYERGLERMREALLHRTDDDRDRVMVGDDC